MIEVHTRSLVKAKFSDLLGEKLEPQLVEDLKKVLFEISYAALISS